MSYINSVSRSMNGIKNIETASITFIDDNTSLNTSAGILQATTNSNTALNKSITNVDFATDTGILKLTTSGVGVADLTEDLDGRYFIGTSLTTTDIPDLPSSKITSGTFGTARIPDLTASKITSGTFEISRIPDLSASNIVGGTFGTDQIPSLSTDKITTGTFGTDQIPSLSASKITSGTFGTTQIPSLSADKTTTGTFGTARIPDLTASKITSGTFGTDQIPSLSASKITSGTFDITRIPSDVVLKSTNQTITGVKTFNATPSIHTASTSPCITAKNTNSGGSLFYENFGSNPVGYAFGDYRLGLGQFRTTDIHPTISLFNSQTGTDTTKKQTSIGFYGTDSVGTGKIQGSMGFYATDKDVPTSDFIIKQVLFNLQPQKEVLKISGGNVSTPNGQFVIANGNNTTFTQQNINVSSGNPSNSSNALGGSLMSYMSASLTTTISHQKILINCVVVGEWSGSQVENKGIILAQGTLFDNVLLRPSASGNRGRILSPFTISYHQNPSTTLETAVLTYVYDAIGVGTYNFFPVLVNTGSNTNTFYLNRTVANGNALSHEIAGSCISLQLLSS